MQSEIAVKRAVHIKKRMDKKRQSNVVHEQTQTFYEVNV